MIFFPESLFGFYPSRELVPRPPANAREGVVNFLIFYSKCKIFTEVSNGMILFWDVQESRVQFLRTKRGFCGVVFRLR